MTLATAAIAQQAPYKWNLGASVGASGYIGDANHGFPFRHPGVNAAVLGRYVIDTRWALRMQAGVSTLSGNTADMDNYLPGGANFKFTASLWDITARAEFNFLPYGIGETYKRLRRWSPYLSVGAGAALSHVDGKSYAAAVIPLGFGVKYQLSERFNLAAEFTMSKTIGNHIDGGQIADSYGVKSTFLKKSDWYSAFCVSFTYEFGERCTTCHRLD